MFLIITTITIITIIISSSNSNSNIIIIIIILLFQHYNITFTTKLTSIIPQHACSGATGGGCGLSGEARLTETQTRLRDDFTGFKQKCARRHYSGGETEAYCL